MLTSCALAACHLYNAYVRKLFCVHLGRSVWRALAAVHPARTFWNILYGQSAKRDVIPYLHAGLRSVIGTYEGRNHRWEGRNPLFTCGLEGRNRDVRRAYNHRWEGRNPLFTFGFEGHNRTYEGRNHTWEGRDPLFTCGFEGQSFRVAWSPWSLSTWGSTPLACFRATRLPNHNPLQLVSSQIGSGECVWLSVGLCSNGAAARARFWSRIRI